MVGALNTRMLASMTGSYEPDGPCLYRVARIDFASPLAVALRTWHGNNEGCEPRDRGSSPPSGGILITSRASDPLNCYQFVLESSFFPNLSVGNTLLQRFDTFIEPKTDIRIDLAISKIFEHPLFAQIMRTLRSGPEFRAEVRV